MRITAAVFLSLTWSANSFTHECPTFTGREWAFTGHLVNRISPGPPNYESLTSGDQPVTRWYLQLPWPACFEEYKHLTRIQLDLTPQEIDAYRIFLGKQVRIEGMLEEGRPGRHTTALVMKVSSLVQFRRN